MARMRQCCATGSLHTGTPTGRIEKLHGLDCYIAEPSNGGNPKGVVVIIPDAFGWDLPNNRILADAYAKGGNRVYLPEFQDGAGMPLDLLVSLKAMSATGVWNQLYKIGHAAYMAYYAIPFLFWNRQGRAAPKIFGFLKALKQDQARDLNIATAGFCWGGPFVTQLCWDEEANRLPDGTRVTVCGYVAHPSNLSYMSDIEKVHLPYSVAAAEHDFMMNEDQRKKTEVILRAKSEKGTAEAIEHELVLYDGAHHGFAVRADENEKLEAEQGKKAEGQALRWFERWLGSPPP